MIEAAPSYQFSDPELTRALRETHFVWRAYFISQDLRLQAILSTLDERRPIEHQDLAAMVAMLSVVIANWTKFATGVGAMLKSAQSPIGGEALNNVFMGAHTALDALAGSAQLSCGPCGGNA